MSIKELFKAIIGKPEIEERYTARMEVRLTPDEKDLFKKYCDYKGMSLSTFVRRSCMRQVDEFLKIKNDVA